ncbi:unnamed protein product [Lepidochelys kempii]
MISMLELVKDSRMRQAFCGVLEKCSRAVNGFMNWEKCSFPRMGESQFCKNILPLYCHVTSNWLTCEELELKQAIIKALGPMMGILLHKKEPQNLIFKEISWPLEQYKEKIDVFHVTKGAVVAMLVQDIGATSWTQDTKESRSAQAGMAAKGSRGALQAPAERLPVLQDSEASRTVAAADPQPPNARDGGETPESLRLPAAEEQVGSSLGGRSIDPLEVAGLTQHALEGSPLSWWSLSQLLEVSVEYKIPLPKGKFQAICSALHNQICSPAKQLSIENHQELFHCVLLLARSSPDDLLAFLHEQLEIEHEAVRVASLDFLRAIVGADWVRKAALHFIRTLLSSGSVENCAAWDLVAYVFSEFSVSASKLDVEEESTIQTLCIDILQCLDTSVNGMTQGDTTELWRSLGGEPLLATQVLQVLIEKIKTPTRTEGSITSETEIDRHLATAEPLSATCAIFEVVSACSRAKLCGNCSHSCFLFSCSRSAKPSDKSCLCQREAARGDSEKDYNLLRATLAVLSIKALESVLFKGGNERLVRAPRKQRTWILLENPKTHHEGVCLLVSLLLRSGLITPEIIQSLLPWVNSPTENHRVTSTAFLAQGARELRCWSAAFVSEARLPTGLVDNGWGPKELLRDADHPSVNNFLNQLFPQVFKEQKDKFLQKSQSINLGSAEEELRCLREALTAPDPEALFQASSKMARVVSEYFPSEQATNFIEATLGGLLSASPTCATAAGLWMKIILKECGGAMLDKWLLQVKKHKKFLMVILIRALRDPFSSEVIGESMKAVAKVLKELKEKDIGSSFRDLTQEIQTYFDNEDDALRLWSFVLFGILARLTKRKWKGYFAEQVRQSWVTLLLHLQDPNPRVSVECRATFHLCVPFLGLKRLQTAVNEHLDGTAELKPEELQVDICRHLAKENAELLENLYKSTIIYFFSRWEEIRAVAAKLAGIILEHTDRQRMKWLNLDHLLMSLQFLKKDPSPSVQLVATEVLNDICPGRVLGE